jgi:shikimate dehydrogenase
MGSKRLFVFDQEQARVENPAGRFGPQYPDASIISVTDVAEAMGSVCGVAHATPSGMAGHSGIALDPGLLRPDLWVADIVYSPLETGLLCSARQAGCRTLDGGGMAVCQAAEA